MAEYSDVMREVDTAMRTAQHNDHLEVYCTQQAVVALLQGIFEETIIIRKELEQLRQERKNA